MGAATTSGTATAGRTAELEGTGGGLNADIGTDCLVSVSLLRDARVATDADATVRVAVGLETQRAASQNRSCLT